MPRLRANCRSTLNLPSAPMEKTGLPYTTSLCFNPLGTFSNPLSITGSQVGGQVFISGGLSTCKGGAGASPECNIRIFRRSTLIIPRMARTHSKPNFLTAKIELPSTHRDNDGLGNAPARHRARRKDQRHLPNKPSLSFHHLLYRLNVHANSF